MHKTVDGGALDKDATISDKTVDWGALDKVQPFLDKTLDKDITTEQSPFGPRDGSRLVRESSRDHARL